MNSNFEAENVPIDSLKFDLEEEIMYEITGLLGVKLKITLGINSPKDT